MSQPMKVKIMNEKQPIKIKATSNFPTVNVGGTTDHSKLKNLDYAHSGHTGFASSEDIPTKISQLENDKGYIDNSVSNLVNYELKGKTGTNLGVSIDNTTYVMTIDLKNTAGDVISTGSVDLPLESMVIGASYDDSTKEIVLTLQSGEEVRFSVADLVSGLVSQSTFDTKMNEISQEFSHKFDMPYYYEYNGDTDFEDTSETTLAMFNEIKELMEAGQKPCIIVKKGATGANSYITYHFIVPQFGSLDTTYIMLKGSPVRKDGSTFNLVSLNCEKDPETNQIKRVYEKKADGSIEIGNSEETIDFIMTDTTAIKIQKGQKFLDYYLKNGKAPNAKFIQGGNILILNYAYKYSDSLVLKFYGIDNNFSASYTSYFAPFVRFGFTDNVVTEASYGSVQKISATYDYSNHNNGALTTINTKAFTPTADYHPATKKYVDDNIPTDAIIFNYNDDDDTILEKAKKAYKNRNINVYYIANNHYKTLCYSFVTDTTFIIRTIPYTTAFVQSNFGVTYRILNKYQASFNIVDNEISTMSQKFAISWDGYALDNNYDLLGRTNTTEYTPTGDYNPATKKYVDDKLTTITGYDATKTQTLKNINGVLTWQTDGE